MLAKTVLKCILYVIIVIVPTWLGIIFTKSAVYIAGLASSVKNPLLAFDVSSSIGDVESLIASRSTESGIHNSLFSSITPLANEMVAIQSVPTSIFSYISIVMHEFGLLVSSQQIFVIIFLIVMCVIYGFKRSYTLTIILSGILTVLIRLMLEPTYNSDTIMILNYAFMLGGIMVTTMLLHKAWKLTGGIRLRDEPKVEEKPNKTIYRNVQNKKEKQERKTNKNKQKRGAPRNGPDPRGEPRGTHRKNKLFTEQHEQQQNKQQNQKQQGQQRQNTTQERPHTNTSSDEQKSTKPMKPMVTADDPYTVFGLPTNATCEQIKSRYKELVKKYNSSSGRMHKTEYDNERADSIMSNINVAYEELNKLHACR